MKSLTLEEACAAVIDCKNRTAPTTPGGEYFAVGTPAMRGNTINYDEARPISVETFETWTSRGRPQEGDLLLAREAPIGPVVQVPKGGKIAAGQRTTLLRPDPKTVVSRYLFYLLISPMGQATIRQKAIGSTVPHLRVADVKNVPIMVHSLPEQHAIAEVLGALDDKVAANVGLAAIAEDLLKTYFDGLTLDDSGSEGACLLSDVIELNPAVPRPSELDPVYVEMQSLPTSGMSVSSWTTREPKGGARFQNGDTLLARITPCLENRKTGFVDFLDDGQVGLGSTEYIVMRSRPGIPPVLSYFLAVSERFRIYAIRHMVGTSGRQRVNADVIAEYEVRRPKRAELDHFGAASEPIVKLISSLRTENRLLANTRDTLLPQLMSGRLRVKDAEEQVEAVV